MFTFGNEYANYGPINTGDQIEVTVQGATEGEPAISSVTLTGTSADPTVTVSGSNFGADPPAGTPEGCTSRDPGDTYGSEGLVFYDATEGWTAGQSGDCIGLIVTSWSSSKVVFSFDSEYGVDGNGPIAAGDSIEVTVLRCPRHRDSQLPHD